MIDKPRFINIRGRLLDLSVPKVMGIINVTPDSFYEGSRITTESGIIKAASAMLGDGADILDVGGFSSRPGAENITSEEEKNRVLKALIIINREFPDACLSVDTFRSEIADQAVNECGAGMVNDISGGEGDDEMFETVRKLRVPYILMHMKGMPWNMQVNPVYNDVVSDLLKWFGERIFRLRSLGINDIILDPGFGFGKRTEHNFEILRKLGDFSIPGLPLMVGISRKSMVWKTLDITPAESLAGTIVLNTLALMNGADILRVHDVKEAVQAIRLVEKFKKGE
jgi:dihydropteroate synthase